MPAQNHREFLPNRPVEQVRKPRTDDQMTKGAKLGLDYPFAQVGVTGNITVGYDPSLGTQGQTLANQMLGAVLTPYNDMQVYFGIKGGPVTVVIAPLSGANDGTGGAYHYGCDFNSGGVLYLDATFANTTINPLSEEIGLYLAELSEAFMGAQGLGWGCGFSNGEGLSRFCAEQDGPIGGFPAWGITGPAWAQAGFPDWVSKTEQTDRNYVSTGCAVVYLYWMRLLGFNNEQITQAGGATLAANYQKLTGKTTAYQDLMAALKGKTVTSDNPFTPVPANAGWHLDDLTAATGAPAAASDPFGYVFNLQGTQHVLFRSADNHVRELWWDGAWHANDLTVAAKAPNAVGNLCGHMFVSQETQHAFFRGADNHIHELWWDGAWHTNDLTAAAGAPAAAGDPCSHVFGAQGTQHVFFLGTDAHIHELWWDGAWHTNDLTVAGKAGAPSSDPFSYMFDAQGTQHVVYRGTDQHIHELWWDGAWHANDLTSAAGAPVATGKPFGYLFEAQRTQHVFYRSADNHIHELWWDGAWHANDLTAAAGAPAAASDPAAYVFAAQGTQHVVYNGSDSHIHELWWNGSWHTNDLTAAAKAENAAGKPWGYVFNAQGTQHVIQHGADNHICELWWG